MITMMLTDDEATARMLDHEGTRHGGAITIQGGMCQLCGYVTEPCLDGHDDGDPCEGPVEYRMPLSGTGRSFPRCEKHWANRLDEQEAIDRRYPATPPSDWSPLDAGESWDEDF